MTGTMFFTFCVALGGDDSRSRTRSTASSSPASGSTRNLRELREALTA